MAGELARANRLLRARRYRDVVRLLEPEVFRFRQSFKYFYLLGLACLYAGDFAGAASYLERARDLDDDPDVLAALAAIHLRRGNKDLALRTWLEMVERWPRNRQARRGLALLRRGREPAELAEDVRTLRRLYPRLPLRLGLWLGWVGGIAALVFAAGLVARSLPARQARTDLPDLELPTTPLLEAGAPATQYSLSERQVREGFERAKRLLLAYRDNEACLELNRLLLSNADRAVKDRAQMLKSYVRSPDFTRIGRTYSWSEVAAQPRLYDGCYVLWRGRIANLTIGSEGLRFDFLVGYERGTELLGIVPAEADFLADLASGDNIELIARLLVDQEGSLRLQVRSLREILVR